MWIDLNVPYYGTADTAHPDLPGCRQIYPAELTAVMNDVFERRCIGVMNRSGKRWPRAGRQERRVGAVMRWDCGSSSPS
jgi:hypothetical protein